MASATAPAGSRICRGMMRPSCGFVPSCLRGPVSRVLVLAGVCALVAWGPLAPLHAQSSDLRVLEAVKRRDDKALGALIRTRADVNAAAPDGATALAWAIHLGERRMAEALLDAGAAANTADEYGESPVTLAAANGDAELIARLLKSGGDRRGTGGNGENGLVIAANGGRLQSVGAVAPGGRRGNATGARGCQD